ncbi:NAD-dependent epimerase [Maribacter sp. 2-571]|uniref:NAD-dependent epimerase n=1 Tax=Maribacter sp. 2-571 TaxID=3417569 RepID=UPI003D351BC2
MKILVTGAAGFIGFHVCKSVLKLGHQVVGLDNINDYYDPNLKYARLKELGIPKDDAMRMDQKTQSITYQGFIFIRSNLENRVELPLLFKEEGFDVVCNLAAQAGVRYSLEHPETYIDSNIVGFLNVLECCRNHSVKHLVYASSSSVYGLNEKVPFSTTDRTDRPVSLYAASKKTNELMAHTYSHLFQLPTTGLRFFTVYGPWGRPDMALFLFTKAIHEGNPIKVFNNGELARDFTYIDDIVEGVVRVISKKKDAGIVKNCARVYNIGNNNSVKLMDFIQAIETQLGKSAEKEFLPMQPGDVSQTWADVSGLIDDYGYRPNTPLVDGVEQFVKWYLNHYGGIQNG